MGSPLGAIIADIFMVELYKGVVSTTNVLLNEKKCKDDTFCFVKSDNINFI